jgi:dephospho-CoA kinase
MKIIGITGGIGSGKSVVLNIIKDIPGVFTIEADALGHQLFEPGETVYKLVVDAFGEEILSEDKRIDRRTLGSIVMNDEKSLEKLNLIVHPKVKEYIINDIEAKKKDYQFYFIEAALLIQDGYKEICDEIWYIYADRETRIQRLIEGRGFTKEKAESYMDNQPADEYFISNSDRILDNSKSTDELKENVLALMSGADS